MTGAELKLWSFPFLPFWLQCAYIQQDRDRPIVKGSETPGRTHVRYWSPDLRHQFHLSAHVCKSGIILGLDQENRRLTGLYFTDVAGNQAAPTSFPSQGHGHFILPFKSHMQ